MPFYVFQCEQCGSQVERLLTISERDLLWLCGKCESRMRRVPTAANLADPPHRTQVILDGGRRVPGNWEDPNG